VRRLWVDANVVVRFLTGEPAALIQAIELARTKNVDFVDAVLALQAVRSGESVCTFDQDFKRLPAQGMSPPEQRTPSRS
jgi:predicted nucleic acid-binding protein